MTVAHDLVFGVKTSGEPQVSPDGTRLLYSLSQADPAEPDKMPTSALWTSRIDGSDATLLTSQGHRDGHARWSPDGTSVAFTSDRGEKQGLFVVPLSGGEPVQLATHPFGLTWVSWSPDGRSIAYTVPVDPEIENEGPGHVVRVTRRVDYKEDGRGYLGNRRSQVFVAAADGSGTKAVTTEPFDHHHPLWSPDGTLLAFRVLHAVSFRSRLAIADVATGAIQYVSVGEGGTIGMACWSPSGDRLLIAGEPTRTSQLDFYVLTVDGLELRRLTDDLQILPDAGRPNAAGPSIPLWLSEHQVLFHGIRGGRSGIYTFDLETAAVETEIRWDAENSGMTSDASVRFIVQTHGSHAATGEISVYDRTTHTTSIVTSFNTELLAAGQPAVENLTIHRNGLDIESWLLFPPDFDPARRYPMILHIHGGPHSHHGETFVAVEQAMARSGFLVLSPNPRGSGSYGRDFATRVLEDWGGEDYKDLQAVVDEVLERPYVDSGRLGLYGYSYGGFMTSWTIGHTDRYRAAVCGAPCFDLASMYGTSDIGSDWGLTQWGGTPHDRPEWYRDHSPVTYAHLATTPTLVVHGEADDRCPIGQGEELFIALSRAGVETQFARYPGCSHGFTRLGMPSQRVDFVERTVAWLQSHLMD